MNSLRRVLLVASATLMFGAAASAADANVTGEWELTVESQMGTSNPHFSLKQDGGKITGTYKGMLGEAPVTGTVKGNEVTFSLQASAQGMDFEVTYSGTVDGATMQGTVKLGDFGDGRFTGKKAN